MPPRGRDPRRGRQHFTSHKQLYRAPAVLDLLDEYASEVESPAALSPPSSDEVSSRRKTSAHSRHEPSRWVRSSGAVHSATVPRAGDRHGWTEPKRVGTRQRPGWSRDGSGTSTSSGWSGTAPSCPPPDGAGTSSRNCQRGAGGSTERHAPRGRRGPRESTPAAQRPRGRDPRGPRGPGPHAPGPDHVRAGGRAGPAPGVHAGQGRAGVGRGFRARAAARRLRRRRDARRRGRGCGLRLPHGAADPRRDDGGRPGRRRAAGREELHRRRPQLPDRARDRRRRGRRGRRRARRRRPRHHRHQGGPARDGGGGRGREGLRRRGRGGRRPGRPSPRSAGASSTRRARWPSPWPPGRTPATPSPPSRCPATSSSSASASTASAAPGGSRSVPPTPSSTSWSGRSSTTWRWTGRRR